LSSYHALPPWLAGSLSGPGDQAEIEYLSSGQVSRRLVQLRVILDLVQRNAPEAGAIAGLRASFAALAEAQRRHPAKVNALLAGPQVGAWAARCVRLLTGAKSAAPLWVHLAHLGAVAAVAAIQTGALVEVQVPVRAGVVSLPTLGRALTNRTESWGLAVCSPADPVHLDGSPPSDWWPVPVLETDTLSIQLDNVDPYWECFDQPVNGTLDEAAINRWRQQLVEAWAIIARRHGHRQATLNTAIRCLVPLERGGRLGGASASSRRAPGAVALTEPASPDRFAATLVHEIQHFRLYALQDIVPLHEDKGELLYSPWRNDPRGISGLLHAATAFHGVADFWGRELPTADRGAELTYARTVYQLHAGCRILNGRPNLTPVGRALTEALTAAVDRMPLSEIDDEVTRLATDLVAHHRALWRLRNVVPEAVGVNAAANWLLGQRSAELPDSADRIAPTSAPNGDSPLFRLAVAWVEDATRVRADAADASAFADRYPGADAADLPLLAGDYMEALTVRLTEITEGTADADTWASLSVAHGRLTANPNPSLLVTRPELIRAAWPHKPNPAWNPVARLSH
jgi:HEXXH motif-containing protein